MITKTTYYLIAAIVIIALIGNGVLLWLNYSKPQAPRACTTEAKLCPDGSAVGRSGPNCEFAECPLPQNVTIYCTGNNCQEQAVPLGGNTLAPNCFLKETECQALVATSGKGDLIRLDEPKAGQAISSPLVIRGQARGNWYFEASFPIHLYDADGREIAVSHAQALSEWMTTEFVPFEATLQFTAPTSTTGTLTLNKDNPSGLPEHDDLLSVPVSFASSTN